MWKFISRGIRESIERRACRTNVYSQPTSEECNSEAKSSANVKKSSLTNCRYTNGFCGFFNNRGAKDKKTGWSAEKTLSDVLGWSSILAIGWAICQTPCIRRNIFDRNRNDKSAYRIFKCPKTQVSYLVKHALSLHPKHVLPVTNCVGNDGLNVGDWEQRPYGPITVEEALGAAREEYTRTHRMVMGEFELRYGIKALEEHRYSDAMEHFLVGAQLKSPGSMFNLGLCYELGIGTRTDPVKAVEYYRSAAENGHAGAMYNLGVFHAQGRGGLPINLKEAHELFTRAAGLGQTEAQDALKLEKIMTKEASTGGSMDPSSQSDDYSSYQYKDPFAGIPDLPDTSLENYDSLYNRSRIKTSTETFLDFLGIQSSQVLMESAN
uniref:YbeQ_0 protein n=2 Tax=Fopius arisanus TaxID=64838 RepID=A0A0C9PQ57_9HYME